MTSQTPQPNLIPEEWLSAYLDNELDADQRQLVETAVSQNPQLAQLLYDLQATRRLVQQLPSFPSNATLRHPSSSADRKVWIWMTVCKNNRTSETIINPLPVLCQTQTTIK